jgi:hypothetical protein
MASLLCCQIWFWKNNHMRKSHPKRLYNKYILVGHGLLSYESFWAIIIYMFLLHIIWAQESGFDSKK